MGPAGAAGRPPRGADGRSEEEAGCGSARGPPPLPHREHRRNAGSNRARLRRVAEMIFVDSNLPMYLVGAEHPHKADSQRLLESAIAAGERLVTDAEVFQEILHRYVAIKRRDAIQPAFDVLNDLV